nr:hypothetical protein [Tanacetum cinerariifolium]
MNNEPPQTLPSFDSTCYSKKENSVPCVLKPNFVNESSNIFNPPPQPPIYYCEFCESNAQYGHYYTPQAPFINLEPGYSQDFDFPQNIHDFQQQYLCFDQTQTPQFPVNHPPPQETSIEILHDQENELAEYINTPGWNRPTFYDDDDGDNVDYTIAITPVLSIEEPVDSLKLEEVIKSSVEDLVPIPSEFEGIPGTMCDVHLVNNPTPLEAKDHFEIVINSNDDISSNDDDSLYNENIEYVEASPHDSELVSLEAAEIVILEVEEIEDDNLLPCVLKPNFVNESSNIFNPPPQPPIYYCEFCESNAQYGHYYTPQAPFINLEPGYSQDFDFPQNIHEELAEYINTPGWNRPTFYDDDDGDNVDYTIAITPVLSIEEPVDSLSMGDEHLNIIPATELEEVIKSSVEDLVPIPSEFEGIPGTMCDVHLVNNPTPLEAKDHFEIVINSNDDISSNDDDSLYNENIEYVEASPHDSELVSLEAAEIVILEVEEIEDDNLRKKLLNVRLLIANIKAL